MSKWLARAPHHQQRCHAVAFQTLFSQPRSSTTETTEDSPFAGSWQHRPRSGRMFWGGEGCKCATARKPRNEGKLQGRGRLRLLRDELVTVSFLSMHSPAGQQQFPACMHSAKVQNQTSPENVISISMATATRVRCSNKSQRWKHLLSFPTMCEKQRDVHQRAAQKSPGQGLKRQSMAEAKLQRHQLHQISPASFTGITSQHH